MSKKNDKFTPEEAEDQLKQLLAQMSASQPQGNLPTKGKKDLITRIKENGLKNLFNFFSTLVIGIDSFVGLVTKKTDKGRNEVIQEARSPVVFGGWVILVIFGVGGIWATCAPLNSAAVAVGNLISYSNKQVIQHHQGGIIKEIVFPKIYRTNLPRNFSFFLNNQ